MQSFMADETALKSFCNEIDMPIEAVEKIAGFSASCDFSPLEKAFDGLFDIKTGSESSKKITDFCGDDNNGLKSLAVYLSAAIKTRCIYEKKGLSDDIFIDTMKIFSRFVREHYDSFGCFGFDRGWWIYRNLSVSLMRLGLLEFEMCVLEEDLGYYKEGAKALSVHIPSDSVITREGLDESYKAADVFFGRFFPEFKYELVFCHTWLFAPILDKILPQGSKILLFKSDYEIAAVDYDDNEYLNWVFKKNPDSFTDFQNLPEDTGLRKGLKNHILSGGKVGTAYGILRK